MNGRRKGNWIQQLFWYVEPMWLSSIDNKMSLRAVLAMAFSIDFISSLSFAVRKWSEGRSYEGLAMVLGIEAGLIAALLALTTYQNTQSGITKSVETSIDPTTSKTTVSAKGAQAVSEATGGGIEQVKE